MVLLEIRQLILTTTAQCKALTVIPVTSTERW